MEFIIFIAIPFCGVCFLLALFVRGTQGGFARTGKYLLSRRGGLLSFLKACLILAFKGSKAVSKHGYGYLNAKIEELDYRRDSAHEIQDVIVNIEDMLPRIDDSIFYVELREIEKNYRYFKREYKFFRDSPLFKKRSVKRVKELNSELRRLLAMAESIEASLSKLYRDQEGTVEGRRFTEKDEYDF